jgi:exopolyphosphatase/guanosine-5'-triphosphate,3'-diphosphate pyrophosphatase
VEERPVGAAIDVGSNSVHLLVARIGRRLTPLRDESVLLGLGDVVDRDGQIPIPAQAELLAALSGYVQVARLLGAAGVSLVGTEPLRRAANGQAVARDIGRRIGLPLHVLSERQEGELTYLGVTGGATSAQTLLVVDVGGGSSEVVLAEPGPRPQVTSLPSGSGRLSVGIVEHDPPTADELDLLLVAAHGLVDRLAEARPARAVFVGGTATNLARIAPLRRDGLALAYRALGALPAAQVSERFGVNLRRARQLPAGAAIVDALLAHFRLDEAAVSKASLRDGAIICAHRLGDDWPARLSDFVAEPHVSQWPAAADPVRG